MQQRFEIAMTVIRDKLMTNKFPELSERYSQERYSQESYLR